MKVYHCTGGKQPREQNFSVSLVALDGDFEKIRVVDATSDTGAFVSPKDPSMGRHIELHDIPTKAKISGPRYPILDFYAFNWNTLVVPQAFKDIIDELEPDVHQFFPLALYRGKNHVTDRYWFIFGQRLDTLDFKSCIPPRNAEGLHTYTEKYNGLHTHVFSIAKIDKAHAWVDKRIRGRNFSEQLVQRIQELGLTGLQCNPAEAI